jgi:hypothetical protein
VQFPVFIEGKLMVVVAVNQGLTTPIPWLPLQILMLFSDVSAHKVNCPAEQEGL